MKKKTKNADDVQELAATPTTTIEEVNDGLKKIIEFEYEEWSDNEEEDWLNDIEELIEFEEELDILYGGKHADWDNYTEEEYIIRLLFIYAHPNNAFERFDFKKLFEKYTINDFLKYQGDDERKFYDSLPDKVTIYRGCKKGGDDGISWTTSLMVANRFALDGIEDGKDFDVVKKVINKSDIRCVITEMEEDEIIYLNN